MIIKTLVKEYNAVFSENIKTVDLLREKAKALSAQADALEHAREKPVELVKRIAAAIADRLGCGYTVSGPAGIFCRYFLDFGQMRKDITNILEREYSITLHHDYTAERGHSFSYETGETVNMFAAGTIGAINGGNIKTAPLPDSLDELVEIVRSKKKNA